MWWLLQYVKSSFGGNFGVVSETAKIYRGAKPDSDTLKKLWRLGVRTILDLRDGPIGVAKERAERAGFQWLRIPMSDGAGPDPAQVRAAIDLLDLGCIFVHCVGGRHRTGLIVACWRVRTRGWTKAKAWAEAKRFGYYGALGHQPIEDWFFRGFDPEAFKQ